MSLKNSPWARIITLFPPKESLISDIPAGDGKMANPFLQCRNFLFSGHEPIYFIENKEKTLRASYDRGTQIVDYMD
jgi:hypothetical protein